MPAPEVSTPYSLEDWLFGCVNFFVPQSAVDYICATRGADGSAPYAPEVVVHPQTGQEESLDVRLLKADLYKWIVLGPGKVNNTSDSDNGWSHSDGGYTLSADDKKMLMDEANAIYEELEPESVFGKTVIRMRSAGIMPALRTTDGVPLPRVHKY